MAWDGMKCYGYVVRYGMDAREIGTHGMYAVLQTAVCVCMHVRRQKRMDEGGEVVSQSVSQ